MKIFVGLTEIGGYYTNLRKGFDDIGVESVFINVGGHPFKYRGGEAPNVFIKLVEAVGNKASKAVKSGLLPRVWWKGLQLILMVPLFLWAVTKYDVFIFGFRSSFLFFYDLPILKFLNKKIIYVFHGSDSRPPYIDGSVMATSKGLEATRGLTTKQCIELTRKHKRTLKRIERYANIIISHPPSSQLHEKKFIRYLAIGVPNQSNKIRIHEKEKSEKQVVRILHAPSHREAKGTPFIHEAIARLKARNLAFEFIELVGKRNDSVLNELALCDFVVDQIYSDTPMAHFATEAAGFGKPAIVGGYGAQGLYNILAQDRVPPSHYCHPDHIEHAIQKLIVDKGYRLELGKRAKQFVEENWRAKDVAERFLQLIDGRFPEAWLYDPTDIRYLHGWGLSEARVKRLVKAVIDTGGKEALQLSDKPELERLFLEFAYSENS